MSHHAGFVWKAQDHLIPNQKGTTQKCIATVHDAPTGKRAAEELQASIGTLANNGSAMSMDFSLIVTWGFRDRTPPHPRHPDGLED